MPEVNKPCPCWAGIDVGAGKGFDAAVVDRHGLVSKPARLERAPDVVRWLAERGPRVVAVDCPRLPARDGERSRRCERQLVGAGICGIRYTPDRHELARNASYYAWITNGLELYAELAKASSGWRLIECFPTATWSRLGGRRGGRSRAVWSRQVLAELGLGSLPGRMNQDARDAVGAAVTARLYEAGATESFGEIVVPLGS